MLREEMPSRGSGVGEGLAARLYDPLWLLARQWQFGEFEHEDAASPATIDLSAEVHRLDQWRSGSDQGWLEYDVATTPLERAVEEHGGGPTARLRVEGGLRLRRLLAAANRAGDERSFVARCPFPAVQAPEQADELLRARVADGAALADCLARLASPSTRDDETEALGALQPLQAGAAELAQLAETWLVWWRDRSPRVVPADEDCWDEHRMEHQFALRSSTLPQVELRAQEYAGGRLDWMAVDAVAGEGGDPQPTEPLTVGGVPAPARFGGMPAARLWEMEDAQFDPGAVDAGPIDLGRLMLVSFATVYGNDWFVVPVRLPVSSLSRITRFQVIDVFGERTDLTQIDADVDGWNLFGLTDAEQPLEPGQERPTSPWFLLAPTLPAAMESRPTDVVRLLRDEMVNVGWAVEDTVTDDHGRRRDRFEQWAANRQEPAAVGVNPAYRVASVVPEHWFPLVPEQLADLESVRLRLVPIARSGDGGPIQPWGSLLPPLGSWVHEEEVPRAGVKLVRTWQYARWHDGSRHVWRARRKLTGAGEGSSGLRFDQVVDR